MLSFFIVQLSHPYMTTRQTIALYRGPAPVGSRDSLGRTALAKRIAQQRDQRHELIGLHRKPIKPVTSGLH